jgi:hypothetical protein
MWVPYFSRPPGSFRKCITTTCITNCFHLLLVFLVTENLCVLLRFPHLRYYQDIYNGGRLSAFYRPDHLCPLGKYIKWTCSPGGWCTAGVGKEFPLTQKPISIDCCTKWYHLCRKQIPKWKLKAGLASVHGTIWGSHHSSRSEVYTQHSQNHWMILIALLVNTPQNTI